MAEIINFEDVVKQAPQGPKFDPTKKYTWSPETNFTISGHEFGLLLNTLRSITSTKEAQTIILAHEAGNALEKTLASGVESGIIVEIPENK
jgi:hypothetical protein